MKTDILEKLQERLDDLKQLHQSDYHEGLRNGMQIAIEIVRGCIEHNAEQVASKGS